MLESPSASIAGIVEFSQLSEYEKRELPGFDYKEDKPPRLRTDPNLEVVRDEFTKAEHYKLLQSYGLKEATLTIEQKLQLIVLFKEYDCIMSKSSYDLGLYNGCKHKINVGTSKPIYCRPRPLSHAKQLQLRKDLDDMTAAGILRPSTSPWCSPILYVLKPDKTWRLVIDYIPLNKIAEVCGHPLPKISSMISSFRGMKYFTGIDLIKGFWQIGLDEESIPISAITTPLGQYEFTRLPFGINSALPSFRPLCNLN